MFKTIKRFAAATISLALTSVMFLSLPAWAQNLAEAARQERERRKALPSTHHVYTNEDLAKPRILVPEDQARVEAHNTNQSSPVIVAAMDASHPSSPFPITVATTASEAPLVRRRSVVVPPPPVAIYNAMSFADFLALPPAQLVFPAAESSAPKVPNRRAAAEFQAPPDSIHAVSVPVDVIATSPAQLAFPAARAAAPKVSSHRAAEEIQDTSDSIHPVSAPVSVIATPPAQLVFPAADSSAPKSPNQRAAAEPHAPSIVSSVENAQVGATAADINMPFPVLSALHVAAPSAPIVPGRAPVTPPAIHPASCTGPCSLAEGSELNGIIAMQSAFSLVRPASETASIQPANAAEPESTKSQRVAANGPAAQIRVQIGDSLWKLAKRYLGNGKYWRELAALNRRLPNPGLIRPGELIQLPGRVSEEARQVVVQPGDTLWTVAETAFGTPLAFNCIAHANPQLESANVIHPGQTLLVPETCAAEPAQKDQAGAL